MAPIINSYNPEGVDESTLRGTGRGGILSDGYLRDEPLAAYLGDDERPVIARSNTKKGVSRGTIDGDETEQIAPGDGYRAFALATDTRLLFVVGDTDDGDRSISVPLADVEVVEHSESVLASEFVVTTAADVQWYFPCRDDLSSMVDYLDAASMRWIAVEERLDDARAAVDDADSLTRSRMYDDAMAAVRDAMAETDAARQSERELSESGVRAITARIERVENRIADVRLRALEGRAAHTIDLAEDHWRDGEYEAAHDAYGVAHDDYEEALAANAHDDEVADRLRQKLERVERNVAALERAPVDNAEDARDRAEETDDLRERADELEFALDRYRTALELDWGRSAKRFEGDPAAIRDAIDTVARELVETRRRFAAQRVQQGDRHRDGGQLSRAESCYRAALDALAQTVAPARELVPDELDAVTDHRDAVEARLRQLDTTDDQTPIPSGSH
ncbi:hypothetical protein [Halosimplex salinum]|uniref:hypothetical protein n=1 Tax=Halosimplex salinum TaxID=1710538 RepID=UPI000F485940|nr:hypothetical protein [Halosimplex salinum]